MNKEKTFKLKISEDDPQVGYLYLPDHPGPGTHGVVKSQKRLVDIIENYKGIDVYLDFDNDGRLLGIEFLG